MISKYVIRLENIKGTDTLIICSTLMDCYKLLLKDTDKLTKTIDIENAYCYVLHSIVWALLDMETDEPELMTKKLEKETRELDKQLDKIYSDPDNPIIEIELVNKLRDLSPLLSDKQLKYMFSRMQGNDNGFHYDKARVIEQ